MPVPTRAEVMTAARGALGDNEVAGGQVYTNTALQPFFAQAYREMFRAFDRNNVQFINKFAHYNLPANQTILEIGALGVSDFGQPINLRERTIRSTFTVSAVTPDVANDRCQITTSATHDFVTGDTVVVYGISGITSDINDEWTVEKVDSTNVRLLGCRATGALVGTGTASASNDEWSLEVEFVFDPSLISVVLNSTGLAAAWQGQKFRLNKSSNARQLRIMYSLSGSAPTADSDSCGVHDCLDFLAKRTACLAAKPNGATDLAAMYEAESIGSQQQLDAGDPGGSLGDLVNLGVQTLNGSTWTTRRFRPRRATVYEQSVWPG